MTKSRIFFDTFYKKYFENKGVLDSYLKNPSEKNIHNIRISIRRLESIYMIFPKTSRTKISDKYIQHLKYFFSLNSKIRDYDVILKKLNEYGYDPESKLVLTLMKKKIRRIMKSVVFAKKISELNKPKIKYKKINFKFEKKILSLIYDFKNHIPIVLSDESKINELHSMRKTLKKLRYILEIEPENTYQNIVSNLKQLQKILGDIHDCDMTICYLQKNDELIPSEIISSEKFKRHVLYTELLKILSSFESKEKS